MLPIAHRGLWFPDPSKQNTPEALLAAAEKSYGLETDIQLFPTTTDLIIQHDDTKKVGPLGSFIQHALPAFEKTPLIFWNLKAENTEELLADFIVKHDLVKKSIVFDWEMYTRTGNRTIDDIFGTVGIQVLTRYSDRNECPSAITPGGRWVDQWDSDWLTADWLLQSPNKPLYIVSSELHGRIIDLRKWREWLSADGICTDYPEFLELFARGDLDLPPDAWWSPVK